MTNRAKLITVTILLWLIAVVIYAFIYISSVLNRPVPDFYANQWDFQLLSFALTRLPLLIAVLICVVGWEIFWMRRKSDQ